MTSQIKFVADVMVGKLARWLRVLGYDVAYSNAATDNEIIRIAQTEARVILTRDTGLAARLKPQQFLFIESDHYREQLQQVLQSFQLKSFAVFSRCLECNTLLREVDKEEVFERVPPFVYLTQQRFAVCPTCDRVYWHGTHADQILQRIRSVS